MNPCAKYKSMHGFKWTSSKTRNCKCILRFLKNVRFPPARFLDMHNTYVCCKSFVHTINILIDRRVNVCHNCVHKLFVLLAKRPPPQKKTTQVFWSTSCDKQKLCRIKQNSSNTSNTQDVFQQHVVGEIFTVSKVSFGQWIMSRDRGNGQMKAS